MVSFVGSGKPDKIRENRHLQHYCFSYTSPDKRAHHPPADYFGPTDRHYFPEDFIFGMAGSAAQIEGAVAEEGRALAMMERLILDDRPKVYVTNEKCYLYKQYIERMAAQGVEYYSFNIAWTRILPFALPGTPVNKQGIDHYND